MKENVVDIDESNAREYLIEESFKRPVLVDFWADWCGPCKNLMPVLEKLAEEYAGQFLLARINADQQQMLSAQFGVRSLPTVLIMRDGQPVDGFTGAQPEQQIRELLDQYLPKPWDAQLEQGRELVEQERVEEALPILREAYTTSEKRADIACTLAEALLATRRFDEAEMVLKDVRFVDQDAHYKQLLAQLELAREATKAPEVEALEQEYRANPDDLEVTYQLAVQYSQYGHSREALELLFNILKIDLAFKEGEARRIYMDIIASLGKGDPIAVEFQRKIYALLY